MAPKTTEQLLQEVAKLQDEVSGLHKQRNIKEGELKTLTANKKLSDLTSTSSIPSSSLSPSSLQQSAKQQRDGDSLKDYGIEDTDSSEILLAGSAALAADAQRWQLESAYRMGGITTFAVKDPGPDRTDLLGVRIEVFVGRTFQTPYYIILSPYISPSSSKTNSSSSTSTNPLSTPSNLKDLSIIHLTPHRHTIPSFFVPLFESLVEKYLPPPPAPQNLLQVVKGIRAALTLYHTRLHHLENIEKRINTPRRIENPEGVYVSGFKVDPEARLLIAEWLGSAGDYDEDEDEEMQGADEEEKRKAVRAAVIAITEEGGISGVVVKEKGKRVRNMERQISGDPMGSSKNVDGEGSSERKKRTTTMLAQVLGGEDKYDMPIRNLAERLMWNGSGGGSSVGLDDAGDVTM